MWFDVLGRTTYYVGEGGVGGEWSEDNHPFRAVRGSNVPTLTIPWMQCLLKLLAPSNAVVPERNPSPWPRYGWL